MNGRNPNETTSLQTPASLRGYYYGKAFFILSAAHGEKDIAQSIGAFFNSLNELEGVLKKWL